MDLLVDIVRFNLMFKTNSFIEDMNEMFPGSKVSGISNRAGQELTVHIPYEHLSGYFYYMLEHALIFHSQLCRECLYFGDNIPEYVETYKEASKRYFEALDRELVGDEE